MRRNMLYIISSLAFKSLSGSGRRYYRQLKMAGSCGLALGAQCAYYINWEYSSILSYQPSHVSKLRFIILNRCLILLIHASILSDRI